jgi:hypothetical protein
LRPRFQRPRLVADSGKLARGNSQSCAYEGSISDEISGPATLLAGASQSQNLADGCLYWVKPADPFAAAGSCAGRQVPIAGIAPIHSITSSAHRQLLYWQTSFAT